MLIIVASNHTRIGAWVKSKVSAKNPLVYCTIPLIAMQGYHTKTEDTGSLDYNSFDYTYYHILYYYYYVWYFVFLSGLSCTS